MSTSIIGAALAMILFPANATLAPAWINDYRIARDMGTREQKPLLVVLGSGRTPWANLAEAAQQDTSINTLLLQRFVCVFVDTDSSEGQRLAQSFEMSGSGLVISDRTGHYQAFRRHGEIPIPELSVVLQTHAEGRVSVAPLAPATSSVTELAPIPAPYPPPLQLTAPPVYGGFNFSAGCTSGFG